MATGATLRTHAGEHDGVFLAASPNSTPARYSELALRGKCKAGAGRHLAVAVGVAVQAAPAFRNRQRRTCGFFLLVVFNRALAAGDRTGQHLVDALAVQVHHLKLPARAFDALARGRQMARHRHQQAGHGVVAPAVLIRQLADVQAGAARPPASGRPAATSRRRAAWPRRRPARRAAARR
jgi:hypothetical protein